MPPGLGEVWVTCERVDADDESSGKLDSDVHCELAAWRPVVGEFRQCEFLGVWSYEYTSSGTLHARKLLNRAAVDMQTLAGEHPDGFCRKLYVDHNKNTNPCPSSVTRRPDSRV
jgi:hypothetical protein